MPNVISIKRKEVRINRNGKGDGIIRVDSEAANVLEKFLSETGTGLSVKELASSLIKYAANDTIIKYDEED